MHNTAVSGTQIKTMWTLVSVVEIKQRWHQVPGSFGQRAAGSVCTGARGPASLESSLTVSYKIECLLTQRPGHKRPQQLCSLLPEAGKDQDACHQVNRQAGVAHPYPSAMHSTTDTNSPPAAWMEPTFALVCCPSAYRRFQRAFP